MKFKEAITGMIPACTYPEHRKEFEVAVVNGRTGEHKLGKLNEAGQFIWMGLPWDKFNENEVYDWTHTDRTLLIIL